MTRYKYMQSYTPTSPQLFQITVAAFPIFVHASHCFRQHLGNHADTLGHVYYTQQVPSHLQWCPMVLY